MSRKFNLWVCQVYNSVKKKGNEVIDLLIAAGFLGLETDLNQFTFVYDERVKSNRILARKVKNITGVERYRVNLPFHSYLKIKPVNVSEL